MADEVDDRIVAMKFDNAAFEAKIRDTLKSLETLQKSLDLSNSAKGLQNLDVSGASASLNNMASSVEDINSKFSAMGAVAFATISRITNSAIDMVSRVGKSLTIDPIGQGFQEFELKMGSVQTIMAGSGESLDVVNEKLETLNKYSDDTIYSFRDMTSNIGKFTNAGVSLDASVKAIQGIANVAALSGANAEEASRAMYNFSQALSSGFVKLVDWKSIELANMATVEFKQQLIDTAVSMGKLTKVAGGYETEQGTVITATKNFNDSLQDQWMTSEALTETLAKYTDETTDLGKRAASAAKDVKTFSQMMATMKESAASGWAQTFELIFGNFEKGKELWTGINNVVGGFIENMATARNDLLKVWSAFGGQETLFKSFKNIFEALGMVLNGVKYAFRNLFPPATAEGLLRATASFSDFSIALKEATERVLPKLVYMFGVVFSVLRIATNIVKGVTGLFVDLFRALIPDRSGTNAIGFFGNLARALYTFNVAIINEGVTGFFKYLSKVLVPIARLIGNVAGAIIDFFVAFKYSEILETAIELFGKLKSIVSEFMYSFRSGFTVDEGTGIERFALRLRGLFIDLVDAFKFVGSAAKMFFEIMAFRDFRGGPFEEDSKIVDNIFKIRDAFVSIGNAAKNIKFDFSIFGEEDKMEKAGKSLENLAVHAGAFSRAVSAKELGDSPLLNLSSEDLETKSSGIKGFFQKIQDFFSNFIDTIQSYKERVENAFGSIGKAITKFFTGNEVVSTQSTFQNFLDVIQAILITGILFSVYRFIKDFSSIMSDLSKIFKDLGKMFKDFAKESKSTTLIKIAIALVLLAGALKQIAEIPQDKLLSSFKVLGAGLLVLMLALKGMDEGITGGANLKATAASLILVSVGIRLLAEGVKAFGDIDPDKLKQGMISAGLALAALAASVNLMRTSVNPGSALVVVALAGSMFLIAKAVEAFAKFKPEELAKGIIAMAAAMAGIGFALSMMGPASILAAPAVVILALALGLIADGVERFAGMKDLDKGIAAMFFALLSIAAPLSILGPQAILGAAGILIVAKSLEILSGVIEKLAALDLWALNKAIAAIAIAFGLIVIAANMMSGAALGAAGLLVTAFALSILADAIIKLGSTDLKTLAIGIGAITVVLLGLAAAGFFLSPFIAALGAAMLVLGAGMLLFGAGVYLTAKAWSVFAEAANRHTKTVLAVLELLARELPRIMVIFVDEIGNAAKEIAKSVNKISDAFADIVVGFLDAIIRVVPKISETVDTIVMSFLTFIGNRIVDFVDMGFKIILALGRGLLENTGELTTIAIDIIVRVLETLAANAVQFVVAGVNLILALIDGLGSKMNVIVDRGGDLIIYLMAGIASKTLEVIAAAGAILIAFLDGLTDWIHNNADKIHDSGANLAKAIIEGLIVGLVGKENMARVEEAIKKLAGLLPEWAQKVLGIKSPSTVFKEIGGHIGAGLAQGLDQDSLAKNAAVQHAERIVSAFSKALGDMPSALNGMDELNPVITPVLDLTKVAAGAQGINSMMGATISPDVSTAQARLIATTSQSDDSDPDSQNGSSITELTFNQNIYAPQELSTNDIYRNTKSQIAMAKEELGIK